MPLRRFQVEPIPRLQQSTRRGLAFLICFSDPAIDAKAVYEGLDDTKRTLVRNRFDHWIQGGVFPKYFHGWDDPNYRECFVFKWKDNDQHQRLYGFLIHPRPKTAPRFEVCVLVSHAQKNAEATDPSELNGAKAVRQNVEVVLEVKKAYPEIEAGRDNGNTLDRGKH